MPLAKLLVEIRTEELPPFSVQLLAHDFPKLLRAALIRQKFTDDSCRVSDQLATPRRFAALLDNIRSHSPQKTVLRRGPQMTACHAADGAPTKALVGFMRAVGVTCEKELIRVNEKGRDYVAHQQQQEAESLQSRLAAIVDDVLLKIAAPRLMRWDDNDFKFIRRVCGVFMMHGNNVIQHGSVMGVAASDHSIGHPVLAGKKKIRFIDVDEYEQTLKQEGFVLVNRGERRRRIEERIITPTKDYYRSNVIGDYSPEDKNTDNCEFPIVCEGRIAEQFLSLPDYCLIECLIKHQSAFLVMENKKIGRRYQFVIDNDPPQETARATIVKGFNNVVHARLQDVSFYRQEDKKISQDDAFARLAQITYHHKLGNQQQRVLRLQKIVEDIAEHTGLSIEDKALLKRAATICKCDLSMLMVQEYPELEGRVAADYFCDGEANLSALVQGHNEGVMPIVKEPKDNVSPALPHDAAVLESKMEQTMKLAMQLERLVGMFGISEKPSGSKDPHGLRRAAQIVTDLLTRRAFIGAGEEGKILTPHAAPSLRELILLTRTAFERLPAFDEKEIRDFILERERSYLLRLKRVTAGVLNAVLANDIEYVADIEKKAAALCEFMRLPEAAALIEVNKRVNNILRKSGEEMTDKAINESLFESDAERNLHKEINAFCDNVGKDAKDKAVLNGIVTMKPTIDRFFNEVLVNAPISAVRTNRLLLLAALRRLLRIVGDLSKLDGGAAA